MTTEEKLLTADEYYCLYGDGEAWTELIDGKVVQLMPPGADQHDVVAELTMLLRFHAKERRVGRVLVADTGIRLRHNPDTVRGPDICFFAAGRLPSGRLPRGYLDVIPDFVVEVVSPWQSATYVRDKTEEWLQAGVRLVWNVFPESPMVVVAEPGNIERVYRADDILTGAPVLPDFEIRVADLFAE